MPERIGIFGGTFDPPHLGHLILAAEALDQLGLSKVLWVLTPVPPHKLEQTITPLEHRLVMTQLMLGDYPQFELSRAEIDRPGPHYMLETIRVIKTQSPGADAFLLVGGDSLQDLPNWNHPSELISECQGFGVMRRSNDTIDLKSLEEILPGLSDKVQFFNAPLLEISSRDIRKRISEGRAFRHYLTPLVHEYILKNGLYLQR
jgi:nicotinate-nucleotide adenylyltransferase